MLTSAQIDVVVADALAREFPAVTPRAARLARLPGKADALVGTRRVGKTYLLLAEAARLRATSQRQEAVLYVNFEDERLAGLEASQLGEFLEAQARRCPEVLGEERWLLLDEVQVVEGWERFVRRMLDRGDVRVMLTGSSARLLGREIATSLRGRALSTEILPFSFGEVLAHHGMPVPTAWPAAEADRARLGAAFERYLVTGGFPEVLDLDEELRRRVLRDYMDVALLRDVIERHRVSNVVALRALHSRLLSAPAGRFATSRFHNDLRSMGLGVNKESLYEWVSHFEDACFAFFVGVATESEAVRRVHPRKFYPVDHGLAPRQNSLGQRLETLAFLELRRRGHELAYFLDSEGREVDFVATGPGGELRLVQACADLGHGDTRQRELSAMIAAMSRYPGARAEIVTRHEREVIDTPRGPVHVFPGWEWCLRPG